MPNRDNMSAPRLSEMDARKRADSWAEAGLGVSELDWDGSLFCSLVTARLRVAPELAVSRITGPRSSGLGTCLISVTSVPAEASTAARRCVTVSYSSGSPRLRVFPSTHSRANKCCGPLASRRAAAINTVELGFTRDGQIKALSSVGRSVAKSTTRYSGIVRTLPMSR
jgi:hypothetical protein